MLKIIITKKIYVYKHLYTDFKWRLVFSRVKAFFKNF